MREMTMEEAEIEASKLPLPAFDSNDDEMECAQYFARTHTKTVACFVLGLSENTLKKQWRLFKKQFLQSRRFREWCSLNSAKYDEAREKYILLNERT